MANTYITQSVATNYVIQAWAQKGLLALRNNIVLAKHVAKDVDFTQGGWKGQTLNIRYPGTFTAQDKVADTLASPQTPAGGANFPLVLSKHKTVDIVVEDAAQAVADVSLADVYAPSMAKALAEQVESDLWQNYLNFTAPEQGTIGTNLAAANIASAKTALDKALAPLSDRFLVVSPKDHMALIQDSNLANYFAFQASQAARGVIESGTLPEIYGFQVDMSQLAPVVQGSTGAEQTLTQSGSPTGGSTKLTFGSQQTAAIAYNATAAAIQSALAALSSVGAGNVICTGGPLNSTPVKVWFVGALSNNTSAITATDSYTGGSSPATAIANGSDSRQVNVAFHKEAVIMAVRPFADVPSDTGALVAQANDPLSGLSLRVIMQYNAQARGMYIAMDILYGTATLRGGATALVLDA